MFIARVCCLLVSVHVWLFVTVSVSAFVGLCLSVSGFGFVVWFICGFIHLCSAVIYAQLLSHICPPVIMSLHSFYHIFARPLSLPSCYPTLAQDLSYISPTVICYGPYVMFSSSKCYLYPAIASIQFIYRCLLHLT